MSVEEDAVETISREFMAIGNHFPIGFITKDPRGTQANDNPFRLNEVFMSPSKMGVDLFEQRFFSWAPKVGVMAEGTIELPSYFDDLIMGKRSSFLETFDGLSDAGGIVKHSERIHLGVKAKTTTDGTNFIGKTGAEKEDAITVRDGWG